VIGFTKTLALELGEWGIRANAIAPGAVDGDRIERVFAGRAHDAGKSISGQVLPIDNDRQRA
jgi:NAD(P)-dependent dehydrogenase (short-subunit alcohol dehydrogenase family)